MLIGSGGREHALAWKLAQSPSCHTLYAAPGNPGIAQHAQLCALDTENHAEVLRFCVAHDVALVVIGPELPLVAGLADDLRAANIATFGPGKAAAQLEGSKAFTKLLCAHNNIPTAAYGAYDTLAEAQAGLAQFGLPVVIKADGLAAGKGVVIAETMPQAQATLEDMFGGSLGEAGARVVLEEFLTGEEVSFFALSDGKNVVPFGSAQDHKRVGDGDTGANTGGMGAYSPAAIFTPALQEQVMADIILPTVAALARAGTPYIGVLYAGLMLTPKGPQLIEYNARFGDPECQVLMPRFQGDLAALLYACATGNLNGAKPQFSEDAALTVVLCANGYPAAPHKGGAIILPQDNAACLIFHAGTSVGAQGRLITNGGRVLNVTALAPNVQAAQASAYDCVAQIDFPTGFCRKDIGWREVERLESLKH